MQWITSFQALSSYVCVCTCVGLPLNVGSLSFVLYANLSLNCNGPTKYLPKQGFLGMDKSFVSITGFEAPSSVCVCGSSILCWAFHCCGSFTVCACVGPLSLCSLRKSVCLLRILTRQARMLSTNNLIVAEHLFIISSWEIIIKFWHRIKITIISTSGKLNCPMCIKQQELTICRLIGRSFTAERSCHFQIGFSPSRPAAEKFRSLKSWRKDPTPKFEKLKGWAAAKVWNFFRGLCCHFQGLISTSCSILSDLHNYQSG